MNKAGNIIGWIATALLAVLHLFAGVMKFMPIEPGSETEAMAQSIGTLGIERQLGVLELVIVALFLFPRTSAVGFILMVGYMGGTVATPLTHGFTTNQMIPMYVMLLILAICGYFRFPEFTERLRGK